MKPVIRTARLMALLGWQGGTIHDACREVGLDVDDFLYGDFNIDDAAKMFDFKRGYAEADDIALYLSSNRGNLNYWFGAISKMNNDAYRALPDQVK